MKSKLLVLTLAPAMLIATARLCADGETSGAGKKPVGKHHDEIVARFDKDGDGKLNEEEKAAAKSAVMAQRDEIRGEALKRHDANGDGKLDEAERKAARDAWAKANPEKAEMLRDAVDKDGDGVVSEKERRAAAKEMRKKAKQKRGSAETGSGG